MHQAAGVAVGESELDLGAVNRCQRIEQAIDVYPLKDVMLVLLGWRIALSKHDVAARR